MIGGKRFFISGRIVRILALRNEIIDHLENPVNTIQEIEQRSISADLMTFLQLPPDNSSTFPYHMQMENLAVVRVSTYDNWLKKQIHDNTRKMIRKASKIGVRVLIQPFSDSLAAGLVEVFNETPIRRGRRYPYYGWDIETVRRRWATELDRSLWIVAYYHDELIGFIKLIIGDYLARATGTVTKVAHRDKASMNALLAKAVEICASKSVPYLVYGKFIYGRDGEDSLTAFKKRNGFEKLDVPRYFIPLSFRGRIALRLGLHRGLKELMVPAAGVKLFRKLRSAWYEGLIEHLPPGRR